MLSEKNQIFPTKEKLLKNPSKRRGCNSEDIIRYVPKIEKLWDCTG